MIYFWTWQHSELLSSDGYKGCWWCCLSKPLFSAQNITLYLFKLPLIFRVWETQLLKSNAHSVERISKTWRLVLANNKRQVWINPGRSTAVNKLNAMTGSGRKLLFYCQTPCLAGRSGKWGGNKRGSLYSFTCHHFLTKPLINISLHFGSIMKASKACEGNIFLTYRNLYIYKQEKLPVKAVTSLSEVAEWFFPMQELDVLLPPLSILDTGNTTQSANCC